MKRFLLPITLTTALISVASAEDLKPAAWVPLPAVGSSPETGFQYGLYVMRIFPQSEIGVPQNRTEVLLQGTTQGQFQAYVWPDFYFNAGDLQVKGKLGGKYWPSDYFGQGNDTVVDGDKYADTAFEASLTIKEKVTDEIRAGLSVFGEYHQIEDIDEDIPSALLDSNVSGFEGGLFSGVGINANWDTRNNIDWPTEGQLISLNWDIFTSWLGSDINFNTLSLKASQYVAVGDDVLSVSAQYKSASDDTPFTHLPKPTGDGSLRGANGNRWMDQQALGIQGEYRMTLSPRWAIVGFTDAFQVAETFSDFSATDFHFSTGAGVRFGMTPDRFNIRLDVGYVDFESLNFAITVGEAF